MNDEDIFVFEQYNILLSSSFDNLYILNLKKNKIEKIDKNNSNLKELTVRAAISFYENNILFLSGIFDFCEFGFINLSVYNIKEKKMIKNKELDFYIYEYGSYFTQLIKYYKKRSYYIMWRKERNEK